MRKWGWVGHGHQEQENCSGTKPNDIPVGQIKKKKKKNHWILIQTERVRKRIDPK